MFVKSCRPSRKTEASDLNLNDDIVTEDRCFCGVGLYVWLDT